MRAIGRSRSCFFVPYWFREASVPEPAPPPDPAPAPEPAAQPAVAPAFEALTAAEQYALLYPDRAASIRAARGLPASLDFGPPDPEIVQALIGGTTPIILALDTPPLALAPHHE